MNLTPDGLSATYSNHSAKYDASGKNSVKYLWKEWNHKFSIKDLTKVTTVFLQK